MARALVFDPNIILLDEPLSNLDFKLRESMRIELKALQIRTGVTTIYVTHDQIEAMVLSDKIILMNNGKIVQIGTPLEIYNHPKSKFVVDFIGKTNSVIGKIKEITTDSCLISATEANDQTVRCKVPNAEVKKGDQVVLSIRPEDVNLNQEVAEPKENVWLGKIRNAHYLGNQWDYIVKVGKELLWVSVPVSLKRFQIGDKVNVALNSNGIMVWENNT